MRSVISWIFLLQGHWVVNNEFLLRGQRFFLEKLCLGNHFTALD